MSANITIRLAMKKIITILSVLLAFTACQACSKEDKGDNGKDQPKEFVATSWNGEFLKAVSEAYEVFVETDRMPVSVNVEGISYSQAKYFSAACNLISLIETHPDDWQEQPDVDIPKYSSGSVMQWNTFETDSISLAGIKWMIGKMSDYASAKGMYPNYCSFGKRTWKSDRSGDSTAEYYYEGDEKYVGNIIFPQALIILARVMNYYKNHLVLPKNISTWWSDFLRSTDNCPIDDPVVVAAMNQSIAGKSTAREKAEAIFIYARDQWEWENYNNTRKGAVGTINAKGGNCCDLSHAVVAMCRAAGIPARYIHGQCYFSTSVIGHVISQIYVDGQWYTCDASNDNATFGHPTWKGMQTFNGLYDELPF